jgi:hypothetical protein
MNLTSSFIKKASLGSSITRTLSAAERNSLEDIAKPSSILKSYNQDDILSHSLSLTNHIFGLYAIELWRYDERNGKLIHVSLHDEESGDGGGLLVKRMTQESDPTNSYSTPQAVDAYRRLTDASFEGYLRPVNTDVGVGLPGVLWAESASNKGINGIQRGVGAGSRRGLLGEGGMGGVSWRNVEELANDPDQVSFVSCLHSILQMAHMINVHTMNVCAHLFSCRSHSTKGSNPLPKQASN